MSYVVELDGIEYKLGDGFRCSPYLTTLFNTSITINKNDRDQPILEHMDGLEDYLTFISTGIMPSNPNWELFRYMGHDGIEYYPDEYNIMRMEDEWVRLYPTSDPMFGLTKAKNVEYYEFLDNILGDIEFTVDQLYTGFIGLRHQINTYGVSREKLEKLLEGYKYEWINDERLVLYYDKYKILEFTLLSSDYTPSKFEHMHNIRPTRHTIIYKGAEYITRRQSYYMDKKQCYLELGVNDMSIVLYPNVNMKCIIPNYECTLSNSTLERYMRNNIINLPTYWALLTRQYHHHEMIDDCDSKWNTIEEFIEGIELPLNI